MEDIVQQEFERIRQNIGKIVEVVEVFFDHELVIQGVLQDFSPYSSIDVFLGKGPTGLGQELSVTQTCAFTGVKAGIKEIRDEGGNVLYNNSHLNYKKRYYHCWNNPEDNAHINNMRRAKFGEGHDFQMIE